MQTHNMQIRKLRLSDAPRWRELWNGYLAHYKQALAEEITEFTWRRLIEGDTLLHGAVAVDARSRLIGFVHYHFHLSTWSLRDICYLEDLFVADDARGCGAGRALIETVYREADRRGATRVYWHTESTNLQAQALYDRVAVPTTFIQYRRQT
jgi:GNAT superfamily N-acetyltransferase